MEWITRLRFNAQGPVDLTGKAWTNNSVTFDTDGKFGGKAAYFNNGSHLISPADTQADLELGDFTLSFWFKGATLTEMAPQIIGSRWNAYTKIQRFVLASGKLQVQNYVASPLTNNFKESTETVLSADWVHCAITRKNGRVYFFKNGVLMNSDEFNFQLNLNVNALGMSIGSDTLQTNSRLNGYLDDICVIKGIALWTETFTPPASYLLLVYRTYLSNDDKLYGKVGGTFTKLTDTYSAISAADKKTMITSTNYEAATLDDLRNIPTFKIVQLKNDDVTPYIANMNVVNLDSIILPKSLLSLNSIEGIDNISLSKNITGTGSCKMVVTVDLATYKTFNGTDWVNIDINDINAIKTSGMDTYTISTIPREKWDALVAGTAGIGFAYLPTIEEVTDTCAIADINLTVDMKGSWDMPIPGTDYKYNYPQNNTLRVSISTEGSYKINYRE